MRRKVLIVVALVLVAGLAGCVAAENDSSEPKEDQVEPNSFDPDSGNVQRFVDEEADVVCYKFTGFEKGGISCMPIDETQLYGGAA